LTVALGSLHSCALDAKGEAACFGANYDFQLGTGNQTDSSLPLVVPIPGVTLVALAADGVHTCALDSTGGRWCWGEGEFGMGPTTGTLFSPELADTGWKRIESGPLGMCGIKFDDSLWCWGYTGLDEGAGPTTPTQPNPGQSFRRVALGDSYFGIMGAAIRTDGTLHVWEYDTFGYAESYHAVGTDNDWVEVAAGWENTCAIKANGVPGGVLAVGWGHGLEPSGNQVLLDKRLRSQE
jgi:alpha-tubulin suppressor-like RCC1 family protein